MRLAEADIRPYEGLVISTAALLVDQVDDDFDDIAQVLRLTVARALVSYDKGKATQTVQRYVFSCVLNRRKDIGSRKRRPEDSLDAQLERDREQGGHTEAKYLRCDEVHYTRVTEDEPVRLPATLTQLEVDVLLLGLRDYNQTEVARELGVTRQKVREAQRSIQRKMADWKPTSHAPQPVSYLPPPTGSHRQAAA